MGEAGCPAIAGGCAGEIFFMNAGLNKVKTIAAISRIAAVEANQGAQTGFRLRITSASPSKNRPLTPTKQAKVKASQKLPVGRDSGLTKPVVGSCEPITCGLTVFDWIV